LSSIGPGGVKLIFGQHGEIRIDAHEFRLRGQV
jgi:hypothetical protein